MAIDDELRDLVHQLVTEETEKQITAYEGRLAEAKAEDEMTSMDRLEAGHGRAS
jgi:hypothetical protein